MRRASQPAAGPDNPSNPAGRALPFTFAVGPPRLTAGFDRHPFLDLRAHHEVHLPLDPLTYEQLHFLATEIRLTGRGGAGFPVARKLEAVARSVARRRIPPVVVVNAAEGEPASWKDKVLLGRAPHLILDGVALVAHALEASSIVIGVADGGIGADVLAAALQERRMPVDVRVVSLAHRFITGQAGALIRGINGETPIPPGTKLRASDSGVGGAPTLLSNAETFAQLAMAARLGPQRYASMGTYDEPGTLLLSVTAGLGRPSVVECPTGTPLGEVLRACRTSAGAGVLVGGFHGRWLTPEAALAVDVSRAGLARVGGTLGAGVVLVLGDDTCPLGEATRVVRYLAEESAGQCGPCRFGLPNLASAMVALLSGTTDPVAVRAAAEAVRGRGACHHPDGTADFAVSLLDTFPADIAAHQAGYGCGRPVTGALPVPGSPSTGTSRLRVDWTRCEGHGLCVHLAPELIRLDAHGFPVLPTDPLPAVHEKAARRVVARCPALALQLAPESDDVT